MRKFMCSIQFPSESPDNFRLVIVLVTLFASKMSRVTLNRCAIGRASNVPMLLNRAPALLLLHRQLPNLLSSQSGSRHVDTRPFMQRSISTVSAKSEIVNHSTSPYTGIDSYLTTNVFDLLSLKERVTVITGGAKGIGLALAFAVAEAGGKVAIVDAAGEPSGAYAQLQAICPDTKYYQ